jgi:hypothetical protein
VQVSELQYVQRKARNQAIRAYNKVVPQTTITPPAVPSFNKLKNKPLFWVGSLIFSMFNASICVEFFNDFLRYVAEVCYYGIIILWYYLFRLPLLVESPSCL